MYTKTTSYQKCILNEKMMPDVSIKVPELEVVKKTLGRNVPMGKCGGTTNFQTLRPQTLQFLILFKETLGYKPLCGVFLRDFWPALVIYYKRTMRIVSIRRDNILSVY
jgi:hypothetical protein